MIKSWIVAALSPDRNIATRVYDSDHRPISPRAGAARSFRPAAEDTPEIRVGAGLSVGASEAPSILHPTRWAFTA
jgi:hypothetical protein